jgi:hypothetical protein
MDHQLCKSIFHIGVFNPAWDIHCNLNFIAKLIVHSCLRQSSSSITYCYDEEQVKDREEFLSHAYANRIAGGSPCDLPNRLFDSMWLLLNGF